MAEMDSLEEKTLHTEKIFSGNIIELQVDDVELPNGKRASAKSSSIPVVWQLYLFQQMEECT